MTGKKYIISSCVIGNNAVIKNKKKIVSGINDNMQSFFHFVYRYLETDYPKFYKMDNLSKLGWLAAEILIKNNSFIKKFQPEEVGIVLTTANSSLDTDLKFYQTTKTVASPALFVYTLPNIIMGEICIRNNFKGETACFIFENFDAGFLKGYLDDLFSNNALQICLCGWVDVIEEDYKAALFMVAKNKKRNALLFTKQNMYKIFECFN